MKTTAFMAVQCAFHPLQTNLLRRANAARRVPACGDSHPCPVGLSPHAGTLGRGGVPPLNPESPHAWGLRCTTSLDRLVLRRTSVGMGSMAVQYAPNPRPRPPTPDPRSPIPRVLRHILG
jgi:hypothetical protein